MKKMESTTNDYTEADLPLTRKDVFFDCYKERFSLIFRLGLMCFSFLVPLIIISILRDAYVYSAWLAQPEQTNENYIAVCYAADAVFGLFKIIAQTLFAVLFAGVVQIQRQMLWNEPIFFGDDFKKGLKSNSLRFGVTTFILALINYALSMLTGSITAYILIGVFLAIILPVSIWFMLQGIYYRLGVLASIKNALLMYLKTFPFTILLLVCTVVPFWLITNLIPYMLAKYLVLIVLAVIYIIPLTMCWMLYALHIFDRYLNKEHYPQIYRKGMRKIEETENESDKNRSLY